MELEAISLMIPDQISPQTTIVCVLVAVSMIAASGPVAAAQQVGITSPDRVGTVAPGDSFTVTYELSNTGNDDATAGRIEVTTPTGIAPKGISGDGLSGLNGDPPAVFYGLDGRIKPGECKTTEITYVVTSEASSGDFRIGAEGFLRGNGVTVSGKTNTVVNIKKPSAVELSVSPETVNTQPGERFNVTYKYTNIQTIPGSAGSIKLTVPSNIVPLETYGDGAGAINREEPVIFYGISGPIEGESTLTTTILYMVEPETESEQYHITGSGSIQGANGSDQALTIVEVRDSIIQRYDTNGTPGIQFVEVLAAIEDFNTASDIEFSEVLTIIAEFNS